MGGFSNSFVFNRFRTPKTIIPQTFCSTSAASVSFISGAYGENFPITFQCLSGDIHISTLSTAPSTTVGFKMTSGDVIDLNVPSYLSLMSTSTTASYQAIVWDR